MEKRKRCCCGENGKEKSNGIGKRLAKMKGLGFIDSGSLDRSSNSLGDVRDQGYFQSEIACYKLNNNKFGFLLATMNECFFIEQKE